MPPKKKTKKKKAKTTPKVKKEIKPELKDLYNSLKERTTPKAKIPTVSLPALPALPAIPKEKNIAPIEKKIEKEVETIETTNTVLEKEKFIDKSAKRLNTIIVRLMNHWNSLKDEQEDVKTKIRKNRTLKLVVSRQNNLPVYFGAMLTKGKVNQYESDDNVYDCIVTLSEDTFLDALMGTDKFGRPFSINYAWSCGEVVFAGTDWFVHQAVLKEMFEQFKHILKLR